MSRGRAAWTAALGQAEQAPTAKKRTKKSTAMKALVRAHAPRITERDRYARYIRDIEGLDAHDAAIPDVQVFPVKAVPKPRMSQSDVWEKRPAVCRYRDFCDEMRLRGAKLPFAYRVDFVLEMPEGWPDWLKDQMDGKQHLLKPDASNLCKAIEDALVPNDEVIHNQGSTKRWGRVPSITIRKATSDN